MPNKEFILKWAEALESDKYKQGQKWLRNKFDEYCCLGVACDLYDSSGWSLSRAGTWDYKGNQGILPDEVNTFINMKPSQSVLIGMNDEGKTFKEIAQFPRQMLEKV